MSPSTSIMGGKYRFPLQASLRWGGNSPPIVLFSPHLKFHFPPIMGGKKHLWKNQSDLIPGLELRFEQNIRTPRRKNCRLLQLFQNLPKLVILMVLATIIVVVFIKGMLLSKNSIQPKSLRFGRRSKIF